MTAYASYTVGELLETPTEAIFSRLVQSDAVSGFSQFSHAQGGSWRIIVDALKSSARQLVEMDARCAQFGVVFEYRIPRRERRLDVALLLSDSIVVMEFKSGSARETALALSQMCDYALDLAYYHAESQGKRIVPLLCATEATIESTQSSPPNTPLEKIVICGAHGLGDALASIAREDLLSSHQAISVQAWCDSPYRPIPGILEAAVRLFSGQDVDDINSTLANDDSINETIEAVQRLIREAIAANQKVLCLLTGVPGAGKTLVGLRVAHAAELESVKIGSVFLSGNGPLLNVLKAALASFYKDRNKCTQRDASFYAGSLIHSVHSFLDEAGKGDRPPTEQVVIFDEAQRAWDAEKILKMSNRQRRMGGVSQSQLGEQVEQIGKGSEPSQIMSILDRHKGGAVIVALCGTGQEIHDGEAGGAGWFEAREKEFAHWRILCSQDALQLRSDRKPPIGVIIDSKLHLTVPKRSHRAQEHSLWVDAVLSGAPSRAREHVNQAAFPVLVTRDLDAARRWLKSTALGTRRSGLLASSGAIRLRPYGIEVSPGFRKEIDYAAWFTRPKGDLKSSLALEVAATEFECQGLEIDRACVCWCWDMMLAEGEVTPRSFQRERWSRIVRPRLREYAINKYRVLLTRAREGMIIWVPRGESDDESRSTSEANDQFEYLLRSGARELV